MYSAVLCVISLILVLFACRRGASVGLPIAYIAALLLIHLPGGIAHMWIGNALTATYQMTAIGFRVAAFAAIAFSGGVLLANIAGPKRHLPQNRLEERFILFCLISGWILTICYPLVSSVPTLSGFVAKAGPIWIIGAAIGLRSSMQRRRFGKVAALMVVVFAFPAFTLLSTGFLAAASVTTLIALAPSFLLIRSFWRSAGTVIATGLVMMTAFVNYFVNRDAIRATVWGGADFSERLSTVANAFRNSRVLDLNDPSQIMAIDQRLNQNYFVGVAVERIEVGRADYLYGQSLIDGFLALIPRVIWPDKPQAGSGNLLRDATGMWSQLSDNASWGVGNVMELYINLGWVGIVVGMALLGYFLAQLDRYAFNRIEEHKYTLIITSYLVGIALIFPEGSFVDSIGGAGVALFVGLVFGQVYKMVRRLRWQKPSIGPA